VDKSLTFEGRARSKGKRLGCIMIAVISALAVISVTGGNREAKALGGQLFGSTQDLYFEDLANNDLTGVQVKVAQGWLNSDAFSLAIHITSINGFPADHGTYVFPLSEGEVLGTENAQANVKFAWPVDEEPGDGNISYTACVQVLAGDTPIGDAICTTFSYY
jgi:hypothetical protein